jgi:hypothetical protein
VKRVFPILLIPALLATAGPMPAAAVADQPSPADLKRSVLRTSDIPPDGFGNGILQVYLRPVTGTGTGQFTVLTGPQNPAGPGRDILYGQGAPGTSYMIVRDETTGIGYVQGQMVVHENEQSMDDLLKHQFVGDTSASTSWQRDDGLEILQQIEVLGTTVADSRVVVTTQIAEVPAPGGKYRIQYLWDVAVAGDDGPVIQPRTGAAPYAPFGPTIGVEQTITTPAGDLVAVDNEAGAPNLAVATSGTNAESVQYVCWADAIFAPLGGYVTDSTRDISGTGSTCVNQEGQADSAIQYLWKLDPAAGSDTVSASLRMSPRTPYASTMDGGSISLGSATATLTDTASTRPLPGRVVTFTAAGRDRCTETTNANGKATCGGLLGGLLGYDVTYAGGAIWASSTDHGGL